jgi:hypothetical protein
MATYNELKAEYTGSKLIAWNGEHLVREFGNYKLYHWDSVFRFCGKLTRKNLAVTVVLEDGVETAQLDDSDEIFFNVPFSGFRSASIADLKEKVTVGTIKNWTRTDIPGPNMIGYAEVVMPNDSLGYYCYNSGSSGFEVTSVLPTSSSFWETEDPEE